MLTHADILRLVPHQGAMCLLDNVRQWSAGAIACHAVSHLDPANPLRRNGRLAAVMGIEYALQAAALHGALLADGARQPAGVVAAMREVAMTVAWLDDPAFGVLHIAAEMLARDAAALSYAFHVRAESGRALLSGRATVVQPVAA